MAINEYVRLKNIHPQDWLKITRPDGYIFYVRIAATNHTGGGTVNNPNNTAKVRHSDTFTVDLINAYNNTKHNLSWHNCYSFGNGVESKAIGDNFNTSSITPGVKV